MGATRNPMPAGRLRRNVRSDRRADPARGPEQGARHTPGPCWGMASSRAWKPESGPRLEVGGYEQEYRQG